MNNNQNFDPVTGQQLNNNTQNMNQTQGNQINNENNKKSNKVFIVIGIILGIIVLAIIIVITLFSRTNKLVCNAQQGSITIIYNNSGVVGYTADGFTYDLENQQKYAKQIGIDEYLNEFSQMISSNYSGTCERK